MMEFARNIVLSVLSSINLCLHITGSYLLISLYKGGQKSVQHILLINLSFSEIAFNMIILPFSVTGILSQLKHSKVLREAQFMIEIFQITGVYYLYYISMMYLTADRMVATILNIRYRNICTTSKVKKLLIVTWVTCMLISSAFPIMCEFVGVFEMVKINYPKLVLILTALDVIFLILAVTSYCVMFYKLTLSRRMTSGNGNRQTLCSIFLNSKFYISILLISTFLVFTVIPGLMITAYRMSMGYLHDAIDFYTMVSLNVSFIADAAIYIFMQKSVRKLLCQKIYPRSRVVQQSRDAINTNADSRNIDQGINAGASADINENEQVVTGL